MVPAKHTESQNGSCILFQKCFDSHPKNKFSLKHNLLEFTYSTHFTYLEIDLYAERGAKLIVSISVANLFCVNAGIQGIKILNNKISLFSLCQV